MLIKILLAASWVGILSALALVAASQFLAAGWILLAASAVLARLG